MHCLRTILLAAGAMVSAGTVAQVTVSADSLRVILAQGEEATLAITIANVVGAPFPYCLDVLRLGQVHHTPGGLGAGCGSAGEMLVLRRSAGGDWPAAPSPVSLAMTPDGTLYVADSGNEHTYAYTSDLDFIMLFEHPVVEELVPHSTTFGLTFNVDSGLLWWLNHEVSQQTTWRVLLLEGSLVGIATGRRVELPISVADPPGPHANGMPVAASFDAAERQYYFIDVLHDSIWAVDTLGTVVPGYPIGLQGYPTAGFINGLDVHGGEDGDVSEVRLELPVYLPGEPIWRRVVVTDRHGSDLSLETMLPPFPPGWDAYLAGKALRSRVDPNGVMYGGVGGRDENNVLVRGLMAFRPVPLSPSWLTLSHWMGTIPASGSAELTLTFRASQRAPGEYRSTLVVEDAAGVVLASVPLTLVVVEATPANEPGADEAGVTVVVLPNPARGPSAATVTLAAPGGVRALILDVLGRQVVVVHAGPLQAGENRLALPALPVGTYALRVTVTGEPDGHTRIFTVAD